MKHYKCKWRIKGSSKRKKRVSALKAPPKMSPKKMRKGPIYTKICAKCTRSHAVWSSALNYFSNPWHSRVSDGLGQCRYLGVMWSIVNFGLECTCARSPVRSIIALVRSIALIGTKSSFCLISTLETALLWQWPTTQENTKTT